jgi:hypothetical protein
MNSHNHESRIFYTPHYVCENIWMYMCMCTCIYVTYLPSLATDYLCMYLLPMVTVLLTWY